MFNIPIIYEDPNLLVINKPAGLSVHGDGFKQEETLVDWLMEKYPTIEGVGESMFTQKGEEIKKPGIVHRLDKDTSGVLIVAKTQEAFVWLKNQFKDRLTEKTYRAILSGQMKSQIGEDQIINIPIGRSENDPRKRVASLKASGTLREATTVYRVLKTSDNYSYVEANPKTGRTHQLRVHFKALNYPIICDHLYNSKAECPSTMGRQALHAWHLKINTLDNKQMEFEAPLPLDFTNTLDKLGLL